MANLEFINNEFVQSGNVCALASYGTVIEYFSERKIGTIQVLDRYFEKFKLHLKISGIFNLKEKHNLIYDHFHDSCKPNKRGFTYIKELHENDDLETKDCCRIIDSIASLEVIDEDAKKSIQDNLKKHNALAIVLYKVKEGQKVIEGAYHAITIGYDASTKKYFYKDPNRPNYQIDEILDQLDITEYQVYTNDSIKI